MRQEKERERQTLSRARLQSREMMVRCTGRLLFCFSFHRRNTNTSQYTCTIHVRHDMEERDVASLYLVLRVRADSPKRVYALCALTDSLARRENVISKREITLGTTAVNATSTRIPREYRRVAAFRIARSRSRLSPSGGRSPYYAATADGRQAGKQAHTSTPMGTNRQDRAGVDTRVTITMLPHHGNR